MLYYNRLGNPTVYEIITVSPVLIRKQHYGCLRINASITAIQLITLF